MKKPKKTQVVPDMHEYHEVIKYIEQKYNIETRGYKEEKNKTRKRNLPYLDYWHWLLDNAFQEMSNPSPQNIPVYNILNDEGWAPDWVKEITAMIDKEFHNDLEDGGELNVWISW